MTRPIYRLKNNLPCLKITNLKVLISRLIFFVQKILAHRRSEKYLGQNRKAFPKRIEGF